MWEIMFVIVLFFAGLCLVSAVRMGSWDYGWLVGLVFGVIGLVLAYRGVLFVPYKDGTSFEKESVINVQSILALVSFASGAIWIMVKGPPRT